MAAGRLHHGLRRDVTATFNTGRDTPVNGLERDAPATFFSHIPQYPIANHPIPIQISRMDNSSNFAPCGGKSEIEEGAEFSPKFDKDGLIPAMAIDAATREPLMLAYMNEESLRRTLELGEAVYWSRSRQEFWHKGATSGQIQKILEIRTDCDQDALILYVEQEGGGACHTGRNSCFYRKVVPNAGSAAKLEMA